MGNIQPETPQGQPVTSSETLLQNILGVNINRKMGSFQASYGIRHSQRMSRAAETFLSHSQCSNHDEHA